MRHWFLVGLGMFSTGVLCASPEEIYKANCSLCHDGGVALAPRIGVREDWRQRVARGREALLKSALEGVPNTAMMAKGGYPQLAQADVVAAVDYILSRVSSGTEVVRLPAATQKMEPAKLEPAKTEPAKPAQPADDANLVAEVAEALRREMAPQALIDRTDGTRIDGVKVESRNGVVRLSGIVSNRKYAARAIAAAAAVPGVVQIDNGLVSATLLE